MNNKFLLTLIALLAFSSCENADWEFSDYTYSTVYFSYQRPFRVLEMGEDLWDTSLDNAHKCEIYATWGGGYNTSRDVLLNIAVDNSICEGLVFDNNGNQIQAMPSNFYSLASNTIKINKGKVSGAVEVQFTDDFFNHPNSLDLNYVIPLVITDVTNADSILRGVPAVENPRRAVDSDWKTKPKDYILYAVKYINKWDANYLRRGVDNMEFGGKTVTKVRHQKEILNDEVYSAASTLSLTDLQYPVTFQGADGKNQTVNLKLTFNPETNDCVITSLSDGVTAGGSGKFVLKGEENAFAGKDRDVLYLDYTFDTGSVKCSTKDTLVVRDRGVIAEEFRIKAN